MLRKLPNLRGFIECFYLNILDFLTTKKVEGYAIDKTSEVFNSPA